MPKKLVKASTLLINQDKTEEVGRGQVTFAPDNNEIKHTDDIIADDLSIWKRFSNSVNLMEPSHWIFLMLIGVLTAVIWFIIDFCVYGINHTKYNLISKWGFSLWTSYFIWIGIPLFFIIITAITTHFNQYVEGSGIPELKSILAGVYIYKYLSLQTLFYKFIGTLGWLLSGLSIGKEGPYVHLAGWIANRLWGFSLFKDIEKNNILK